MTAPADAGRANPGCLKILAVVFAVFLVLLGALSVSALLGVWDDEPPVAAGTTADGSEPPPATAPAACEDETAQFQAFAGSQADARAAVLDHVTLVCWQPAGELRAEATYPADINATSSPMTWLCATLSGFITQSGRTWQGFTVYSTSAATAGRALLMASVPGGACTNPQHA